MAKKKVVNELMSHEFDGIQEFDNDLPPWWLYMFYFTIAFAFVYLMYFHVMGKGKLSHAQYAEEVKMHEQKFANKQDQNGSNQALVPFKEQDKLTKGKEVYVANCVPCHGDGGQGIVGPNLTDKFWIHGGKFENIVTTITKGVPEKGMVSWGPVLGKDKIHLVASYIWSLYGTNPANPKEPQGEEYNRQE